VSEALIPQEYWRAEAVEKVLIRGYTGDDTNDRVIDLGDNYDLILIFGIGSYTYVQDHAILAYALGTCYGSMIDAMGSGMGHHSSHQEGAAGNAWFRGKVANTIVLGSAGTLPYAFNAAGRSYRIFALKLRKVEP